jgi:nucleotide-binding universal stress UspA family protein
MRMGNILSGMEKAVSTSLSQSTILCIIDFTDQARRALEAAIDIATSSKSRLTILYPYRLNQPRHITDLSQWRKSIDTDATNSFTRMSEALLKDVDIRWEFKPEVGFLDDRVEAFMQKNEVDLVVMSNSLALNNRETFLDMLESINCSLLIVPNK